MRDKVESTAKVEINGIRITIIITPIQLKMYLTCYLALREVHVTKLRFHKNDVLK
jgi:hypothetical protein